MPFTHNVLCLILIFKNFLQFSEAGKGVPEVIILDPNGDKDSVPVKLRQINDNVWRCEYSSNIVGLHSVNIFFNRAHVPGSPFPVQVSPGLLFLCLVIWAFMYSSFVLNYSF